MNTEIWQAIPGYEGRYEASSLGRIKSLARKRLGPCQRPTCVTEKILKQFMQGPYLAVHLSKDGEASVIHVHCLVTRAFHAKPEGEWVVAHHKQEGNKLDNRAENLEWRTQKRNVESSISLGCFCLPRPGESHPAALLTNAQVSEMRMRYSAGGASQIKIAEMFGVTQQTVSKIVRRDRWTHV